MSTAKSHIVANLEGQILNVPENGLTKNDVVKLPQMENFKGRKWDIWANIRV